MGFEKDVRAIIAATPPTRRTVMFTATWPEVSVTTHAYLPIAARPSQLPRDCHGHLVCDLGIFSLDSSPAKAVRSLASEFLEDPIRVNIGSDVLSANHRVSQVGLLNTNSYVITVSVPML
eukprot:scaffold82599_cov33-Tisochrysis_lutea.AAC.3